MLGFEKQHIVAAGFMLRHGVTWWSAFVGMDPKSRNESRSYFNITFYEPVREAIRLRLREIVLGPGAYEAKLRRGGHLVRRYLFVGRSNSVSQAIAGRLLQMQERRHLRKHAAVYSQNRNYIARAPVPGIGAG
jgi:hypothetical protein